MKVKGLLVGTALLALLGGCATYDDGHYGYYGDGRVYSYSNDDDYRYNNGWHRWDGDRYYYRAPDYSWGFSYNQR